MKPASHKRLSRIFLLAVVAVAMSSVAQAQQGVGTSALTITASTVTTHSSTQLDYYTAYYYDAIADGFLWEDSNVIRSGSAIAGVHAYGYMSAPMAINKIYQIQTNHWVRAYYYYYVQTTIIYQDPYGFSWISTGQYDTGHTFEPPCTYTVVEYVQDYYLGSTYVGSVTYIPSVGGIIPIPDPPTQGTSGYIEIYGYHLTSYWGPTSVSIDGGGVSTSITYTTWENPYQVNVYYTIDARSLLKNPPRA